MQRKKKKVIVVLVLEVHEHAYLDLPEHQMYI
jgi:hypothetical protein